MNINFECKKLDSGLSAEEKYKALKSKIKMGKTKDIIIEEKENLIKEKEKIIREKEGADAIMKEKLNDLSNKFQQVNEKSLAISSEKNKLESALKIILEENGPKTPRKLIGIFARYYIAAHKNDTNCVIPNWTLNQANQVIDTNTKELVKLGQIVDHIDTCKLKIDTINFPCKEFIEEIAKKLEKLQIRDMIIPQGYELIAILMQDFFLSHLNELSGIPEIKKWASLPILSIDNEEDVYKISLLSKSE